MSKSRQLLDSYTGDDIGSLIRQSPIKNITDGVAHFFKKREAATGEYHLDRISDSQNYQLRRCCTIYGEIPLLTIDSLELGYLLLDWFVDHDKQMKYAAKYFLSNPMQVLDLVDRALEETE